MSEHSRQGFLGSAREPDDPKSALALRPSADRGDGSQTRRWREPDSNLRYRGRRRACGRSLRAQRVETDPAKGSSDQTVACLRRLAAGVVGSAAACAFRFRPPGTGSKRAGWRRSGAILFAFFGAVRFAPDASRARLRFKAAMRSMTGGGAAISLRLTVSPFILASSSSRKASW